MVLLFGAYSLVDGVFSIIAGLRAAQRHERWWPFALEGLLSLIVGAVAFLMPAAAAFALLFVVAAWAILTGVIRISAAIRLRKEIRGEWMLILNGALSVILGILLIVIPGAGLVTLIWWLGAYAVIWGITLIALVSDAPGTRELKELSLAVNTSDGVVLVVGCSHPGIEKIVEAAAAINPKIRFIAGGFHLVVAPDDVVMRVATALRDRFKVEYVAPGHCTGEPTFAALKKAFGDKYLYAGLGSSISLGPNPGPDVRRGEGPAPEDLATYRKLAAREDPFGIAKSRGLQVVLRP